MRMEDLVRETERVRARLGDQVAILGHHYQRDEIIRFADHTGDSLELSRKAASVEAPYIVFCGVYFMAETAAILCSPEQRVIQPVIEALCPMAEMASRKQVSAAWDALSTVWDEPIIPITYQNSNADVKAFVGERGGAVCTSSNARRILDWAFSRGGRVLFTPDEHLGTNTALEMGLSESEVGVWNPLAPASPETFSECRMVVWKGFCSVHTGFTLEDVARARAEHPGARIVVHPECPRPIVLASDASGSTSQIIDVVAKAPAGSTIVVGTECHMVDRLARQYADKEIIPLARRECGSMGLTRLEHLLFALEGLASGKAHNIVAVDPDTAAGARLALERMLQ